MEGGRGERERMKSARETRAKREGEESCNLQDLNLVSYLRLIINSKMRDLLAHIIEQTMDGCMPSIHHTTVETCR